MKRLIPALLSLLLSGCLLESIGALDRSIKPYGAHWVKEGMTRESRQIDLVQCGGSQDLREGYKTWLSSIPYEVYSSEKTLYVRTLAACMQSKSYEWLDACDVRCLYP